MTRMSVHDGGYDINIMWTPIDDAAPQLNLSRRQLDRLIKQGKYQSKLKERRRYILMPNTDDQTRIQDDQTHVQTNVQTDSQLLDMMSKLEQLENGIDQFRTESKERVELLEQQLTEKDDQIREILKQQDQGQQLAAMQQQTIGKLTEQNQLLLEASQEKEEKKVGFWGRLAGQRA